MCAGQRAREARQIGLPGHGRRRGRGRLAVQLARGIEVFGASVRVKPVVAHRMPMRLGSVPEHAGKEALGGKGQHGGALAASLACVGGVAKNHLAVVRTRDLGVVERAAFDVARQVGAHPAPVLIARAHAHVPLDLAPEPIGETHEALGAQLIGQTQLATPMQAT